MTTEIEKQYRISLINLRSISERKEKDLLPGEEEIQHPKIALPKVGNRESRAA